MGVAEDSVGVQIHTVPHFKGLYNEVQYVSELLLDLKISAVKVEHFSFAIPFFLLFTTCLTKND